MKFFELVTYWENSGRKAEFATMDNIFSALAVYYTHPDLISAVIYDNGHAVAVFRKEMLEAN